MLLHPLAGSRFGIVRKLLREYGGVRPAAWPAAAIMFASHGLRYVSCELEIRRARNLARQSSQMTDPVFIVGHWRSGTTLLANLLSLDDRFFFPTLIEAVSPHDFFPSPLEKLSRRLLPRLFPAERPMDTAHVPMRQPYPQEDEMAMAAMGAPSFYNAFYFPSSASQIIDRDVLFNGRPDGEITEWMNTLDAYWRKLALLNPGRRALIKNPAHSARLPQLRNLYPNANFILLHRSANQTRASTQRLFEHLWPALSLQRYDMNDIPELVDNLHTRLTERVDQDWATIPAEQGLRVSFESLLEDPVSKIDMIERWLGCSFSDRHRRSVEQYLHNYPANQPRSP